MRLERDNSFGFFRFLAASGVIFSHHFAISGLKEPNLFGVTWGAASVFLFFLMSGYLIFTSIKRNPGFLRFCSARALRILPNLFFAISATSIATLFIYSNFENIFEHVRYVVQNLVMLIRGGPRYDIQGVWDTRPYPAINGSIWSLPYEVWCYFILFGLVRLSGLRVRIMMAAALACCIILYFLPSITLWPTAIVSSQLGRLGFWFFLGALCAAYAVKVPMLHSPRFAWFDRGGDASYGMYIFAWPIQQACVIAIPGFWSSMAFAFLATTIVGYLTWHTFERRFLNRVPALTSYLQRLVMQTRKHK